jgi:Zn-dependent protease/CBS domain-containing protein
MFDIPSFRVGRILGIPFEINVSWIVVFVLVATTLASSYFPALPEAQGAPIWLLLLLGVATAAFFFASVLAHEVAHAVVTKAQGGDVEKITLFIFGGVAQIAEEPKSPGRELLMASAGPATSLLIAAGAFATWWAAGTSMPWWFASPLEYLARINLFVGLFNLLPGFPLDGGRVLHSLMWAVTGDNSRAVRWAARSGQVIGWTMVILALIGVLGGQPGLIWLGLVGWFIAWLAGASYGQEVVKAKLEGVLVGAVMTPHPEYVDAGITVEALVQEHMLGRQHSRYPVIENGAIVGLVSLPDVRSVPRSDWPHVRVGEIVERDLAEVSVDAATPVTQVLARLTVDRPGAVLVVHEGHLAGIATRSDVIDALDRLPLT